MGGVDWTDHLKQCYEIDRRSRTKYYLRMFFDLLDLSICNAFIVHKMKMEKEGSSQGRISAKRFRQLVVYKLAGNFSSRKRCGQGRKKSQTFGMPEEHLPVHNPQRKRCYVCSTRQNDCRSNISCSACEKSFCLTSTRNCFFAFHSQNA